jgi:creatinine amidohydrolase/Fe(II)-dependent formamide hydrolase-like protein
VCFARHAQRLALPRPAVRKLVILNSHGGNVDLISIVGRAVRVRAGPYVSNLAEARMACPRGCIARSKPALTSMAEIMKPRSC